MAQKQVATIDSASGAVLGVDLNQAARFQAAHRAQASIDALKGNGTFKRSTKPRVMVDGIDFAALGIETAEVFLLSSQDEAQALEEVRQQGRLTRAAIWLAAAERVSTEEQAKTLVEGFGEYLKAKGHARYKSDKTDFKAFVLAYLVDPKGLIQAFADLSYGEAMKEVRIIRDQNKPERKITANKGPRKPTEKAMQKMLSWLAGMDTKQLTRVYKAGITRAAVLRKKGEMFEAFAK